MNELLGIPYSPWSEKARWALDVRHVSYAYRTYMPLVGEPALRVKLRKWTGTVTVPVLTTDDGQVIGDSADIARWADAHGEAGPTLFPVEHDAAIGHFVALSERGLAAGRALSLWQMRTDDEALAEMVPKALRRSLGRWSARIGALGVDRTLRKYGAHQSDRAEHERAFIAVADELRAALRSSGKTLLGVFTFADVAMAQVLAFVQPPAFGLRIGAASRRSFTNEALCARYPDLVAWRDALYDTHRPRPTG
jgi:glutathione S-transferase